MSESELTSGNIKIPRLSDNEINPSVTSNNI